MKYLSEVEPLINTAITNKFNIFTKNEFTYIFNIFTTTVFTAIYASVSFLLSTPNSLFQVMLYCTAVLIAKKAASCPVTSFPSEPLQGAPSQHVPLRLVCS